MLHPTGKRRERILSYGPSNGGKTFMWTTVASWILKTNSPSKIFVIDTDGTTEASVPDEWLGGHPIYLYDVDNSLDAKKALKEAKEKGERERNDWLVVDSQDRLWSYAQKHFFGAAYDEDMDDFFVDAKRKALERHARDNKRSDGIADYVGGDYGINWQIINKTYFTNEELIRRFPGHVLATAPSRELAKPDRKGDSTETQETIDTFGRAGVKPQGQKDIALGFHTILLTREKPKFEGRIVTTVKERNPPGVEVLRPKLIAAEFTTTSDFVVQYLMGVAKWRP